MWPIRGQEGDLERGEGTEERSPGFRPREYQRLRAAHGVWASRKGGCVHPSKLPGPHLQPQHSVRN